MATWQSGRESKLLDEIIAGNKTIEGRLERGKFADYRVGDTISLRRDYRDASGALHDGDEHAATVRIKAIRHYPDFHTLTKVEDFKKVIPRAKTSREAADVYNEFYSAEDQEKYGTLAIEIELVKI